MTDSQEWWPADFGHYGPSVHPHGLAQRGHLPHRRRPRRRRRRPAALRAAQQLAGQREPRQGAPAAVADQAEIRPENLLGRPDDPRRQRRPRIDGLQDLRFRRRPRRRLGARRTLLGSRGHVAGGRALQRRTRACEPARRGADGPDLRQSGRAERQAGSARGGQGHPRDVLPHGDERRGDRRADRRRPHLRQDPRRRRSVTGRPGAGRRRHRGSGPRLEEQAWHGLRRRRHHRRPGSHLDADADEVEQPLLRQPVQLRMGADEEPGRRASVEGERRRGHDPGRLRQVEEACADHADHGPRAAVRPGLREDLAALLRASGSVRGRVCPRLVQAHAPRHGSDRALSRPARAEGDADLAGPDPRGRSSADRGAGHRRSEGEDPRVRPVGFPAGLDGLGVGVDVPRLRQARRRERRAHSPRAAEGLGGQPAGAAGDGAAEARSDPEGVQRSQSAARRSRSPT